jgi:glycosyltransferase involved in cell wall biosynthesis
MVAQQCKAIVTCSECSRRDIIQYLNVPGSKVTSIPWGVNREMFKPTNDDEYLKNIGIEGLYYFTSSANHPRKNLPLLLESYREYLKLGGRGQLVVLNPEEEHLHGIIDLIEEGRIVILRKISDKELAALYTNAKCSLVLSSYEGFGLPVLESLACNTQVICARNSSLIEAGGDIVDFLDKMEVVTIAQKMLSYDNCDKASILDTIALEQHLRQFSWEECARKYIGFYKERLELS